MSGERSGSAGGDRRLGRLDVLLVAIAFLFTRILAFALGVRFDAAPLDFYWQYVDPALLRDDLWGSVLPLHSQPPLFNLFLGALLHLPEGWRTAAVHSVYLALGLAVALSLLALLARLGAGPRLRTGLALLAVASPSLVLYENLLSPTLPIIAALTASGLFLHRFLADRRLRDGLAWSSLAAALVLTHSLFHLAWMAAALALAVTGLRVPRPRAALLVLGLPLVLGAAWYARSLALYGNFAASSWMGMSLANTAPRLMSPAERTSLLTGERALLRTAPFSPLPNYAGVAPLPPPTGRPVLDQVWKSTGAPNLHHLAYDEISRRYLFAWRSLVRQRPDLQVHAAGAAWLVSFRSAADSSWFGDNRARLGLWVDLARWLGGQVAPFQGTLGFWYVSWLVLFGWAAGVSWGVRETVRALRRDQFDPAALTVAYLTLAVLWVALVGNLVELGENDRFRLFAQPLATALLGACMARAVRRWERRAARERRLSPETAPTGRPEIR